ncbi:cilia- and flagella-associated protein 100 isoform X1 [Sarcophilus harrisii]|uniref:Cilia and flagella associated protein 100 n=1 Tax=Sarcophilus harrisii TaxID=9305 RepID=G3VWF2_SARHA|nr:cilia- and flagella-associated protein 100 isoform X1 [Sarcophilus harrisii]XP_031811752.1 cilia- and flagella-associated protein 100 isoform X1 [Sarcophilus harrisii]XP_031811763.1 cilia- and flagella-associated protein 100 isoform X1 [Sarcophilus harrisii]
MSGLQSTSQKTLDKVEKPQNELLDTNSFLMAIEFPVKSVVRKDSSDEGGNPFHLSSDTDFFLLREKERQKHQLEREAKKTLKVFEKMTYSSKISAKGTNLRRQLQKEDNLDEQALQAEAQHFRELRDSATWKIAVTKDKRIERESLATYIEKNRKMFLIQYALEMKKEEILRLEMLATKEEMKLKKAEKFLEKDATLFDEFLKENDKNSVQAMRTAEREAKAKIEKLAEIREITGQILMIKSEISKFEDNVQIYKLYKEFLYKLSPREWLMTHAKKFLAHAAAAMISSPHKDSIPFLSLDRDWAKNIRKHSSTISTSNFPPSSLSEMVINKEDKSSSAPSSSQDLQPLFKINPMKKGSNLQSSARTDEAESDDELDLYFTDPQQLLDIFTQLEEQNLSLIQNSQEIEETLDEIDISLRSTRNKMDREINQLKLLSSALMSSIAKEEEIAADLQLKSRVFSFGEYKVDYQNNMLASLHKKVVEVYRHCIGDCESSLGTLQMLTIIEEQLDELLENLEKVPSWKIEQIEKIKEKERRSRLREEKIRALKSLHEERVQRALARAQASIKKKTGRRLMYRSEPVDNKVRDEDTDRMDNKEKEEMLFFFT